MTTDEKLKEFSEFIHREAEDEGLDDGAFQEAAYIRRKFDEIFGEPLYKENH
jgi:hypothetical protein